MIHSFLKKKVSVISGAPQENEGKFRFAIHSQGIRQFYDNCKIAKCQIVATLAPVCLAGAVANVADSDLYPWTPTLRI